MGTNRTVAIGYAKVLFELGVAEEIIEEATHIFKESPELQKVLESPVVEKEKKCKLIDRIFPKEIRSFIKVATAYGKIGSMNEIFLAYEQNKNEMKGIVTAKLTFVTPPTKEQQQQMEAFICKEFTAKGVTWDMQERPELVGGFKLYVNGKEYDYSVQGRMKRLEEKLTWR